MAHNEISILGKMFPTKVVQWCLLALLGTPLAAIKLAEILPLDILLQPFHKNQIAMFALWLLIVCLVFALIILDYSLLLKEKFDHRKISHISNMHPVLSFRWLVDNAKSKHWLFIAFICLVSFCIGYLTK